MSERAGGSLGCSSRARDRYASVSPANRWHRLGITLVYMGCLAFAGCGPKSPVVPVSGTVTFLNRDQPEVCRLDFLPIDSAEGVKLRPNGATLQEDGSYKMTPHLGVEGLLPGRYAVRVSFYDLKKGGNPDREGDWKAYSYEAGEFTVDANAGAVTHDIDVPTK